MNARMLHHRLAIVLAAAGLIGLAAAAFATASRPIRVPFVANTVAAQLTVAQEVPAPAVAVSANANGRFLGGVIRIGFANTRRGGSVFAWRLAWRLTYSDLTGAVTAAHIHQGATGVAGSILIPLCGPCATPSRGIVDLTAAQAGMLLQGQTYVNLHTASNPNGEVRGQLHVVRISPPTASSPPSPPGNGTPGPNRDR
jgi:hypothetical protein